jgi:sigma-B regulation protein RsbU (phosphoserine phosphatase)
MIAAHAIPEDGKSPGLFAVQPIDEHFLAGLLPNLASVSVIEGETLRFRIGSRGENPNRKVVMDSENVSPAPPARGFWDADLESGAPLTFRRLESGEEDAGALIVFSHPAVILKHIFSTLGPVAIFLELVMAIIAATFLLVEIIAVVASVRLARTLTGTVHELYQGTKKVESGDFAHRIPVRANDQLSELASSFNGMTARIETLIAEVKEKEKLESELEIARQVQAQLFPKEVPKLTTLELAGVCNPARVVSGDYYDFIPIKSRGAAVVIGDISGKGISAALLMAAVQASLHAQLSMAGEDVSTSALVTRLNRQLYDNTPPEKYATFYCAVYDDKSSRLSYTNAGHLAPILIRANEVQRLESNGTVVGIFPEYPFEQCDVSLQPGDLLAAFTDGITESENVQEEQFGEGRLIELLKRDSKRPLEEIIQNIMNAVGNWAHDPSMRDDITILLARKL